MMWGSCTRAIVRHFQVFIGFILPEGISSYLEHENIDRVEIGQVILDRH